MSFSTKHMPQFDFTTYSSQIFWLSICFAILYYFLQIIIIPRIDGIVRERKTKIDKDIATFHRLDSEIDSLRNKANDLRKKANESYKVKLEEAQKIINSNRDKMLEEAKEKIDFSIKIAQEKIKKFVINSEAKNKEIISQIISLIQQKLID
jgi:F0F1-type ATP synthase membrane subunit b/b'